MIGGEKKKSEKNRIRCGINILVATPGRLLDHIETTTCLKLQSLKYVVLDEADRMLEMGYEKNIAALLEAIKEAKMHGDDYRHRNKKSHVDGDRNMLSSNGMAELAYMKCQFIVEQINTNNYYIRDLFYYYIFYE